MAAFSFNKSEKIKDLLHIWKDSDSIAYSKQKEKLLGGITITASINSSYIPLVFESSNRNKSLQSSLLQNIFNPIFKFIFNAERFINRAVYNKIHLFGDDVFKIKTTTKWGEVFLCGTFEDSFQQNEIELAFPKGFHSKKDFTEIKLEIQLIQPGYSRLKYEEFNGLIFQDSFFNNLDKFVVQEFIGWEQSMTPAISERRLDYFKVDSFKDVRLKFINISNKNIAYLYLLVKELTEKHQWYKTNEDCEARARRKFFIYDRAVGKFLRMLDQDVIKLGKTPEF